jgi:hypothetical protein
MKALSPIVISSLTVFMSIALFAFVPASVVDYISVPGPVVFHKESYALAWSFSDKNYYKQEYIRAGDSLEKFNKMILIDVLVGGLTPKGLVAEKIQEIEKRKGQDSVANYKSFENDKTGEYVLDFLVSEGELYEWNVYRYKLITTNNGKAVLLFGFSFRSFKGAQTSIADFFNNFEKNRNDLIPAVSTYKLPAINIKTKN